MNTQNRGKKLSCVGGGLSMLFSGLGSSEAWSGVSPKSGVRAG